MGGSPLRLVRLSPGAASMLTIDQLVVSESRSAALATALLHTDVALPDPVALPEAASITVVIPVKDRPAALGRALDALGDRLSVLVVDDASDDPASIEAEARQRGARYLRLPANIGPAGARNAGLREVRTPLVAFVDSDVQITGSALIDLAHHLSDPAVALAAPRVCGLSMSARPTLIERYDTEMSSLDMGRRGGLVRPGSLIPYVPSACLVGRASLLADGFDESLPAGEDVDLVWRLVAAGHRVRYDPRVVAHHEARTTLRSWWQRKYLYGSSAASLAERHGAAVAPAALRPSSGAAAALLLSTKPRLFVAALPILAHQWVRLRKVVPASSALTAELVLRGASGAIKQEAALALRHWWPLSIGLAASRRGRRFLTLCVAIDVFDEIRQGARDPRLLLIRRLDDLAYGSGLWGACLRSRRYTALAPRRVDTKHHPSGARPQ